MNPKKCLCFLCAALLAASLVHLARAASPSGSWVPLSSDSRNSVRSIIASEVEKLGENYATMDEGESFQNALLEEKEREDNDSKIALAELEKRFKQAKLVRDTVSSSFLEKSIEYEDSRKKYQGITAEIQNQDNNINRCEKEIVTQQEQLKKYLKTEKQGEALVAVIHTQGMRDKLHDLNRRADEISAPELANYMGTTIKSYTEVVGGILSLDFVRSITEGTAKPVNEEPVRIQLEANNKGTKYLRVKRYELYPFQESGEERTVSKEIAEKSNALIIFSFDDLEQLLSRNGYQIAKFDTSRIRKRIDDVQRDNKRQQESLNETIAAIKDRIANQRASIEKTRGDREHELVNKARLAAETETLAAGLAGIKARKEKTEAELASVQQELNEMKRVRETIIPKYALQASKGGQSPADASIEAIIDKLEEVKNEARVQHSRETVEVTNSELTSYEQARSSTDARVTAVRLIALTNEGDNGIRVRVAFRVRMVISENEPENAKAPPRAAAAPPEKPRQREAAQKQTKKQKQAKKTPQKPVSKPAPDPEPVTADSADGAPLADAAGRGLTGTDAAGAEPPVHRGKRSPSGATDLRLAKTLTEHSNDILCLAFSRDGSRAASGGKDERVIVWDTRSWTPLATLKGHSNSVQAVAFNKSGRYLASGARDEKIIIWDLTQKAQLIKLKADQNVNSLAFNPADTNLASAINSRDISILDATSGSSLRTIRSGKKVLALAYSPDGRLLATAGKEKEVRLWNLTGNAEGRVLNGHREDVNALVFTPNGKQVISAGDDKSIIIWSVADGSEQGRLEGQGDKVLDLAITRNGSRLISAGNQGSQGSIVVWDLKSGAIIKRFQTERKIGRLTLSPDDRTLLVGSEKNLLVFSLE